MYHSTVYHSPVGKLVLACDESGEKLVGLWREGQKYFGGEIAGELAPRDGVPLLATVKGWLDSYFAGEAPSTGTLPLAPVGSAFRQSVWNILRGIPYGETLTYGGIAKQLAVETGRSGMSAQAVGQAVGHNPISIIIPCHRVLGADGSLTGYAGGIEMKRSLLWLENATWT